MSSKPLEVWVPITDLPTLVEKKKSKQTDLNGTPEIHLSSQNIQSVLSQRKLFHTGGGKSENLSVHTLTIFFEGTNLDFFTL